MVILYNDTGQKMQTIQHNKEGKKLFRDPLYITENHNGDIIVSDLGLSAVSVTERGGSHRFYYSRGISRNRFNPREICTDAMSHILVCDIETDRINMIDKDGNFLSEFLTNEQGIDQPYCLHGL
ncbi:uncharacterized protein LOC133195097 [Saccostrea echinata]|uniref:uncharacterized protein LOC133195097 n=1 Tax=Saccostrea echinata TaxID=191078 RepID=UPI002A7EEB52|nr:uncharacterized protein LOC133195097 [Saccostrea echinata]